jgi:hypothetical protein
MVAAACGIPFLAHSLSARDAEMAFRAEFVGDSVRVIGRWVPGKDARGATDAYKVIWTAPNRPTRTITTVTPIDTFLVLRPAPDGTLTVRLAVIGLRRGKESLDTLRGQLTIQNPDAAPPPPDSLKIDTTTVREDNADSVRLRAATSFGTLWEDDSAYVSERDSILFYATVFMKEGRTRTLTDTTSWTLRLAENVELVMREPFGAFKDSVWVVAVNCGCRESGDPNLRYSMARGRYEMPVKVGDTVVEWRDVTPLTADPFLATRVR